MLHTLTTSSYRQLRSAVLPFIRQKLRQFHLNTAFTEDVLHDALLILFRRLDAGIVPQVSYEHYLTGIAYYHIRNLHRKMKVGEVVALENTSFDRLLNEDGEEFLETELIDALLKSSLNINEQKAIELFYLKGYSDKQAVVEQLSPFRSEKVLRQTRFRAMGKLRQKVGVEIFAQRTKGG